MKMLFQTKQELKLYLSNLEDWKKWVKFVKKSGDRIFVGKDIRISEPMTESEIKELMDVETNI